MDHFYSTLELDKNTFISLGKAVLNLLLVRCLPLESRSRAIQLQLSNCMPANFPFAKKVSEFSVTSFYRTFKPVLKLMQFIMWYFILILCIVSRIRAKYIINTADRKQFNCQVWEMVSNRFLMSTIIRMTIYCMCEEMPR